MQPILKERLVYQYFASSPVLMTNYFFQDYNADFKNVLVTDIHALAAKTASEETFASISSNPYLLQPGDLANFTVTFVNSANKILLENYPVITLLQPRSTTNATTYPAYRERKFGLLNIDLSKSFVTARQVTVFTIVPFALVFNFFHE